MEQEGYLVITISTVGQDEGATFQLFSVPNEDAAKSMKAGFESVRQRLGYQVLPLPDPRSGGAEDGRGGASTEG